MTTKTCRMTYRNASIDVPYESDEIYIPAEDSQLTADCACEAVFGTVAGFPDVSSGFEADIKKQSPCLFDLKNEVKVLEIGCGSGFVSAVLNAEAKTNFENFKIFSNFSNFENFKDLEKFENMKSRKLILTACDINPKALEQTKSCVGDGVNVIESDLFSAFSGEKFDMIIFNPPYLPTSEDEKVPGWLNYAFDGGLSGRDTIDRFLKEVPDYLEQDGFILLLISSITGQDEVVGEMKKYGLSAKVVGTTKCSFEELIVLRGDFLRFLLSCF